MQYYLDTPYDVAVKLMDILEIKDEDLFRAVENELESWENDLVTFWTDALDGR